jgi:transposase InsO family protein
MLAGFPIAAGSRKTASIWRTREFVSAALRRWCCDSDTGTLYIDLGSQRRNGFLESFKGRLQAGLLSSRIFETLAEARCLVNGWRLHYNQFRPQRALGKKTPAGYAVTSSAVPSLRLAVLGRAAARRDRESLDTMQDRP